MKEVEVARPVVEHMRELGWTVYQEVEFYGARADIVARLEKLIWVVEVKVNLSLDLMAQADKWRWRAHFVSVAVPQPKRRILNHFALKILRDRGIGVFSVGEHVIYQNNIPNFFHVKEEHPARMIRRPCPATATLARKSERWPDQLCRGWERIGEILVPMAGDVQAHQATGRE